MLHLLLAQLRLPSAVRKFFHILVAHLVGKRKVRIMIKKILIEENETAFIVKSADVHEMAVLEENLLHNDITFTVRFEQGVSTLEIPLNQGDDVVALDKETWLRDMVDDRRPSGWSNWESYTVAEILGEDEATYQVVHSMLAAAIKAYVLDGHAPKALYEAFDTPPIASFDSVNWSEVSINLKA
jgi:hypothetical protein